ncbi:MAG: hypothetical protein K8R54_11155 [Bacteroidales bacterium]|nr:hypothetical protein [Bacteroidales bacterium]
MKKRHLLLLMIFIFSFSCNDSKNETKSDNTTSEQNQKVDIYDFFKQKGNIEFSSIKIHQASFTHDKLYVFKTYPISNVCLFVLMDTSFNVIDSKEYTNMSGEGYEEKVDGEILPNGNVILNFKSFNVLDNGKHKHETNEISGLQPSETGFTVFQPKKQKADVEQITKTIKYYIKELNAEIERGKLSKFVYEEIHPGRHYEKYTGKSLFAKIDDISENDSKRYVNSFFFLGDKIFYVNESGFNIENGEITDKFIENSSYYYYDNLVKFQEGKGKREINESELKIIENEATEYNNEIINLYQTVIKINN